MYSTSVRGLRWLFVGFLVFFGVACGENLDQPPAASVDDAASTGSGLQMNADGYFDIDVSQLEILLESEEVFVIDTHVPFEGIVEGTDISIPYDRIGDDLSLLPPDKSAPIVLYCRSGRMSTEAASVLVGLGYTQIMELDGGFQTWEAAGHTLVDSQ